MSSAERVLGPRRRERAASLAEQARDAFHAAGEGKTREAAEVEEWLHRTGSSAERPDE